VLEVPDPLPVEAAWHRLLLKNDFDVDSGDVERGARRWFRLLNADLDLNKNLRVRLSRIVRRCDEQLRLDRAQPRDGYAYRELTTGRSRLGERGAY
jgi:hypothetical protein